MIPIVNIHNNCQPTYHNDKYKGGQAPKASATSVCHFDTKTVDPFDIFNINYDNQYQQIDKFSQFVLTNYGLIKECLTIDFQELARQKHDLFCHLFDKLVWTHEQSEHTISDTTSLLCLLIHYSPRLSHLITSNFKKCIDLDIPLIVVLKKLGATSDGEFSRAESSIKIPTLNTKQYNSLLSYALITDPIIGHIIYHNLCKCCINVPDILQCLVILDPVLNLDYICQIFDPTLLIFHRQCTVFEYFFDPVSKFRNRIIQQTVMYNKLRIQRITKQNPSPLFGTFQENSNSSVAKIIPSTYVILCSKRSIIIIPITIHIPISLKIECNKYRLKSWHNFCFPQYPQSTSIRLPCRSDIFQSIHSDSGTQSIILEYQITIPYKTTTIHSISLTHTLLIIDNLEPSLHTQKIAHILSSSYCAIRPKTIYKIFTRSILKYHTTYVIPICSHTNLTMDISMLDRFVIIMVYKRVFSLMCFNILYGDIETQPGLLFRFFNPALLHRATHQKQTKYDQFILSGDQEGFFI